MKLSESKLKDIDWFFFLTLLFFCLAVGFNLANTQCEHFFYLSRSFLNGHLHFDTPYAISDVAYYGGEYFWPLGPMPALFLLPFVYVAPFFGVVFQQGILNFLFGALVFLLCYKIAISISYSKSDARVLAFAFTFASVFLGVFLKPVSWYFAQTVSVFLTFVLLYESLLKNRPLLLGALCGLLLNTRATAGLGGILYSLLIILVSNNTKSIKQRFWDLGLFVCPLFVAIGFMFFYNYLRFDNIFEFGYSYQIIGPALKRARDYGLFSPIHLPGNLYYAFLAAPTPIFRDSISHVLKFPYIKADLWGMSLFITSPYLVYLFSKKHSGNLPKILLTVILFTSILVFSYYGIGVAQFSYRYALDFMPYVFLLLMVRFVQNGKPMLPNKFTAIVITSAIFNLWLLIIQILDEFHRI